MPCIRSAILDCPAARIPARTDSLETPAGSFEPIKPEKIRSVARPKILGPTAVMTTLETESTKIRVTAARCGLSRASNRRAEGPKLVAFSAGAPICINGPRRTAAGPRLASAARSSSLRTPSARLMLPPPRRRVVTARFLDRFHSFVIIQYACPDRPACQPRAPQYDRHQQSSKPAARPRSPPHLE